MASAPVSGLGRMAAWSRRNLPTRESMERSRLLRPVAHRVLAPALWRFTRRSVPRGVALGMVTGILFPVAQIPLSALLALPFRANVPTAALTTFITNPFTTPAIWAPDCWSSRIEAPIARVTGWDTPYPHAFEWEYFPGPQRVADALKAVMSGGR